ncbi:glycine--tRNA ligase subunit beta [Thermosynechococcaceae cyanobacterium BACA0444]|uniref:Glycine--tRNA ligase beta subunit n=1 Tax=Pseudocalidococcus azoricus BACA0444 TaxID=2918990 RepID=A0AAE4FRH2_9CYAN|nr:glycine--tRNA ligase subunit beta [Pseudocalidococcus azoricus]MDS3860349.1 glycine--tRNA ligase subunit beta [Pseudocalidococcus azoricus BACA0444]
MAANSDPRANFLLEVGTEELPAAFVSSAISQWQQRISPDLAVQGLTPTSIQVFGTPRRLALLITGLEIHPPDQIEEIKGPSVTAAYKDGEPTKALLGFLKSKGATLEEITVKQTEKGEFIYLTQTKSAKPTGELLQAWVLDWISKLEGKRLMRWGDGDFRFSRPIRWLVSLWQEQVLPISIPNGSGVINSSNSSYGHRVLHPGPVNITQTKDYASILRAAFVEVEPPKRETLITAQIQAVAKSVKGTAEIPSDLLAEVVQLVEWPTAILGNFESEFLQLPPDVITTVMVTHQRYFPVYDQKQKLLPHFITISNGDPAAAETIRLGNERVIRARLADGKFFYDADLSQPLEAYLPKLETVTFQDELGSMAVKVERIKTIAREIAVNLGLDDTTTQHIQRTAHLCKADLVTQMVGEFPELQGRMGEIYAQAGGESDLVAKGIVEHYLPQGAGDALPTTMTGQVVAIADKLDTIVSIFGLGRIPTGSSDPFALRRAANGIINIIWNAKLSLNLSQLLSQTITSFTQAFPKATQAKTLTTQLQDFFGQRFRSLLLDEQQIDYDLVNAVLGEADPSLIQRGLGDVVDVLVRAKFLQTIRHDGRMTQIYETVNRAARLARQGDLSTDCLDVKAVIKTNTLKQPIEKEFYQALTQQLPHIQTAQETRNYALLLAALTALAPTVSRFFDGPESVLVMDEDLEVRQNRLNLLGLVRNAAAGLGDFGAIVKQ